MKFLNIEMMTNLSVDKSVQDEEADEGDDCMDDEVEVDEIILHIECIQTERGCLYFKLGVISLATICTGLHLFWEFKTFSFIVWEAWVWFAGDFCDRQLQELGEVIEEGEDEDREDVELPHR